METEISRVLRPRVEARANYDRLSRWYDWVSAPFERAAREQGLKLLDARPGEAVLEIGFGTGWALLALADAVGSEGAVYGIDPSSGMLEVSRRRCAHSHRIKLVPGDAVGLPLKDACFDAAFMSFTLELFDTPEIMGVMRECNRVLREGGRICVVSLSKSRNPGAMERVYERLHAVFPVTFDCRPIHVGPSMIGGGLHVALEGTSNLWGLPVAIVLATKPSPR
jgi:demethylmenaquinone methyltransferase/2-methoxy-6-polyprenyl-1,4-benzoquinol methylase